jgi:hypothetical protein
MASSPMSCLRNGQQVSYLFEIGTFLIWKMSKKVDATFTMA